MTDAIMDKLRALRSELNCRREHGAEGAEHLLYAETKLAYILEEAERPAEVTPRCPTCGGVGEQTTEQYARHPHRWYCLGCLEWWDESRRKPCQGCVDWQRSYQALRQARADAEKRAKSLEAAVQLAKLDNDSLSAGLRRWQTEFALVSSQRDAALQACRSALSEIQSGDIGHMCRAGDILAVALRTRG